MTASPWYEIGGESYRGSEPNFYNHEDFPWIQQLEDNWQVIRDEILALLSRQEYRLKPYFIDLSFPPKQWKTMGFYFWKYKIHANCKACPRTAQILESLPNMTAGSLSVLEPGANINPHHGDTNAIIRIHLGLDIPAGLPECGFQVGRDIRAWQNGKTLLFCDAHAHSAWNRSDRRRLILIVDVMRPEFANQTNSICRHVLAVQGLQVVYQKIAFLRGLPRGLKYVIHRLLQGGLAVILPLQRRGGSLFPAGRAR